MNTELLVLVLFAFFVDFSIRRLFFQTFNQDYVAFKVFWFFSFFKLVIQSETRYFAEYSLLMK